MIYRLEALDIFCDECHRSFGDDESEPATAVGNVFPTDMHKARSILKSYEWVRRGKKDLCPKCAGSATAEEKRG